MSITLGAADVTATHDTTRATTLMPRMRFTTLFFFIRPPLLRRSLKRERFSCPHALVHHRDNSFHQRATDEPPTAAPPTLVTQPVRGRRRLTINIRRLPPLDPRTRPKDRPKVPPKTRGTALVDSQSECDL